jgi:DNA-binding NarL/FixJ family response regulator
MSANLLCYCPSPALVEVLKRDFPGLEMRIIQDAEFLTLIESPPKLAPQLILCGDIGSQMAPIEVGQGFRSLFQDSALYFTCDHQLKQDLETLKKNGFNGAFILSVDREILKECVSEAVAGASGAAQSYRKVMVADFSEGEEIKFDVNVFLPLNRKYVRFISEGETLSEAKIARLKSNKIRSAYIPASQMDRFYEYVTARLMKSGGAASATEQAMERRTVVRTIFLGILDDAENQGGFKGGKSIMEGIQGIVTKTIKQLDKSKIYSSVEAVIDESKDPYSKAARISSIATLLSLGTGIGNPTEVGIAGLLLDLGFSQLPEGLSEARYSELSGPEKEKYQSHPEMCLVVARQKKLILSDAVQKMVMQHHESFDGGGFPRRLSGKAVMVEAQVLRFSDEIDSALNSTDGRERCSLRDFVRQKQESLSSNPSLLEYDPAVLEKMCALFLEG